MAGDLKQENRGGRGDIKGIDLASQGNGKNLIAPFADQGPKAFSFGAEDQADRLGVIKFVKIFAAASLGSDKPEPLLLQFVHRLGKIRNAGHLQMLERSRGNLGDDLCQAGAPPLRQNDPVRSRPFGTAQNSAEVLGVFNLIQEDKEGHPSGRKDFFERNKFFCGDESDNSLVMRRKIIQSLLGNEKAWHMMGPGQRNDLSDGTPSTFFLEIDLIQALGRSSQDFQERVDAADFIH